MEKIGICLVYRQDMEGPNQTMVQCSSNSSSIYEVLGILHHDLDDSAAESETSEAMMRMTGLELVESATIMRIHSQRGSKLEGLIADFVESSENDLEG